MTVLSHIITRHVSVPARYAFDFLSDPIQLGRWSLGCFATQAADKPGVFTGLSLYDGGRGWFSIKPDATLLSIDYLVGEMNDLVHRISARVITGPQIGYPAETCLVTLMAWRAMGMDDERWARLCAAHEAESFLIKSQIETDFLKTSQ
jgi:hypothetical protein